MTPTADTITQFPLSQRVVWLRYLERTREAGDDYAEVEEAAWDELQKAARADPAARLKTRPDPGILPARPHRLVA